MVDYFKLSTNHTLPDVEPEEDQEAPQPAIDLVWNVHQENGHATTIALRLTIQLPLTPYTCPQATT